MSRINPIDPAIATPEQEQLLAAVRKITGVVPNLIATMAHSPPVAQAYLGFSQAMSKSTLSARAREQITLAVSEANGCEYCLAAHTALGFKVGLNEEEILAARRGEARSEQTAAALTLARRIVQERGCISDDDLRAARDSGLTDVEIAEVVGIVALTIFSNYFNHVAGTEIDFPSAPKLESCSCA